MKVGDLAKYRNTGSVGKIEDIKEEEGRTWALLDTTNPTTMSRPLFLPSRRSTARNHTRQEPEDQLEEVNRLREQIEDIQAKASR